MKLYLPVIAAARLATTVRGSVPSLHLRRDLRKKSQDRTPDEDSPGKLYRGRRIPAGHEEFPEDKVETPYNPENTNVVKSKIKFASNDECIMFDMTKWVINEKAECDHRSIGVDCSNCKDPYFIYTTDQRLLIEGICWGDTNDNWCLDGWGDVSIWPCRDYFPEQQWELEALEGGRFRFKNLYFGTYLDDSHYRDVELAPDDPDCECQHFESETGPFPDGFDEPVISAT